MLRNDHIVAHMGTGEVLAAVTDVADRKTLLLEHFERLYPNQTPPRAFLVGRSPDSKLVMAPLVCLWNG